MRFQFSKILFVLLVLTIGIIFSLPNIFPPDPSVQITTSSVGDGFSERFVEDLENKILEMFEYNLNDYDVLGFTPLYFMVKNNNLNCVKKILDIKININNFYNCCDRIFRARNICILNKIFEFN